MENNKTPTIRFKGFTDPWEQRKFDEVFDCTVPNNTLSRAELSYDEGTVLNVHYGDVLIKYGSVLDVQKDDIPRIPHRCREDFNGALLQDGDVIIADTAEDETTGKACEIGNLQGSTIVSGLHTMVCRPRYRMALGYLGYYLNSNAYHHQLLPLMQGIKVLSLSRSNIQKTRVSYPAAVKEQQLIAKYFSQLDHLITLHQRKYDKLQNIKKSMLEKMFPKNGSNVPEIRFSGFTDPWEQRKLGELGLLKNGMNFSKEAMGIGFPFVNLQNIFGNNVIDVTNLGKAMASDSQLKDYNLLNGDVLFVRSSVKLEGVGEAALVPQNLENTTYSGFIIRFRDEYGLDNNFKRFIFGIESVRNQIMAQATNSANKNISQTVLENLCLKIPNKSEQEKIGLYFSNLDNLITLHQRELEKLQNIKKSMLEKMFV